MVKVVDSMVVAQFYTSACEVRFLIRSDTLWNTIMVNKALYKSMDGSFVISIMSRKGKSITR